MAFEVYVPRATGNNMVAFTKHHIRIGNNLLSKLNGDKIEVAFDNETNKLRLRGTDGPGLTVSKNKIGARGIFTYFNLNVKGSFPEEYDENENAIIVDLNR